MALPKQDIPLNFSQGVDTKTDPKQIPIGKFSQLRNVVFNKGGLLEKRFGFGQLPSLPDTTSKLVTTFNNNLTAIGDRLRAYSKSSNTWVDKGAYEHVGLNVLPLVRSNTNQSYVDSAVSSSGLVCTVFTDNVPVAGVNTLKYRYVVANIETGQNIVAPTDIPTVLGNVDGSPRVFLLGNHFVIVFTNNNGGAYSLQYVAIRVTDPTDVTAAVSISASYTPATTLNFDGVVANNTLYLAWNGSDVGGAIRMRFLTSQFVLGTVKVFAGRVATLMSVTADVSASTPVIWANFYDLASKTGYALAVNQQMDTILAPTQVIASGDYANVSLSASGGVATLFFERTNAYTYAPSVPTNYVETRTINQAGTTSALTVLLRSVGLASKAFILNEKIYLLLAYQSDYQPTYFLSDSDGNLVAKLAYSNGGGYLETGLPSAIVDGTTVRIPYLFKGLIQSVNKNTNVAAGTQTDGIYSQLGINLASFVVGEGPIITAEIGNNLNLTGGFMWGYDGNVITESGFHLYPDSVEVEGAPNNGTMTPQLYYFVAVYEWTDNQGNAFRSAPSIPVPFTILTAPASFTADRTNGSPILTNVSSIANLQVGQAITGTGIPPATFILSIDGPTQVTMTNNASSTGAAGTVGVTSIDSVSVNVPTLRLTYKTENPVKIVLYRWSVAQQNYYQTTSIFVPTLNDTDVDSVNIIVFEGDSEILGNSLLYTTGGVLENIAPPAISSLSLFKSRLFAISSEDGTLWYSKIVLPATPVEMSDLQTIYVAPTIGVQTSTGPARALAPMDDKLVIAKDQALYYLVGNGPDATGANSDYSEPVFITSSVGCDNQSSFVMTPAGLMFQANNAKGIWLLGRDLSSQYIGAPVEDFNAAAVSSALSIPSTNQVRFTLSSGATLMYDYYYGQWGEFVNVPGVSSCIYEGLHTYINSYGQAYQETPGFYVDGSEPVVISFRTGWINLAGVQGFQRAYWLYLLGSYVSPHKLFVSVAYDYNASATQQSIIQPQNYALPYGGAPNYGSGEYGGPERLEQWEVSFQRQRCQAFQITLEEFYDATFGVAPGAGLTLSSMILTVGMKDKTPRLAASQQVG